MNYSEMSLEELKEYAKNLGIKAGNISQEKLIEKIKAAVQNDAVSSVIGDNDLNGSTSDENISDSESPVNLQKNNTSVINSIASAIDELDESDEDTSGILTEDLPADALIPVKSITFGGLTYKSRTNNAIYRWNQIGSVVSMTVAELNEMNNHKRAFLNKPLVVLLDERAAKKFRLQSVYENVAKINNLKKILSSNKKTIEKMVDDALFVNMRDVLISKLSKMIKNKNLTDINIIRLLSRKLQYDFEDMIE